MANEPAPSKAPSADAGRAELWPRTSEVSLRAILAPLASLKLTVVLFAMAIFIVLAGTLAQADKDIWEVIEDYFRVPWWPSLGFAWIDFQMFFPPSFFSGKPMVPGGFYFPGGWLIGALMALNLLAAHGMRFKPQAAGSRLSSGLAVIAVGLAMTWLVIASGSNKAGVQEATWLEWTVLWEFFKGGLAVLWLATAFALLKLQPKRKTERATLVTVAFLLGGLLCWILYEGDAARLGDSSMRILWQLIKGTFAGGVLLAGCMMVFKKRAGIVLMHGGIALMMLSEVLVGTMAVEGQMQIEEGRTVNFVQDIRALELAVVDHSDPNTDDVVIVPESILLAGGVIQNEKLPFDVEVVKFLKNASVRQLKPDEHSPADKGIGLRWTAEEIRPGAGTDTGGGVDMAAAYVKLTRKGSSESLGTYLVSLFLSAQGLPETLTLDDGTAYEISLRFKRNYKPYSVHLIDVRKDDYMGTDTPKNYSSQVRLVDESRSVDRKIRIWMNNPLRYAGETFYQSGYYRNPQTGGETTTLAVVTNTGWMIPYVSCMIVAMGMLAHFSIVLLRFLNRRSAAELNAVPIPMAAKLTLGKKQKRKKPTLREIPKTTKTGGKPSLAARLFPVAIVVLFAAWLGGKARLPAPPAGEMNLYEFGKIPVVYQGRPKPIDTLARNSLRIISDKQTFVDANGKRQPAIRWLLDVLIKPEEGYKHKVVRIDNLDVLDTLELKRRQGFRYSVDEIQGKLSELSEQADRARSLETSRLSLFQKKILELENKLGVLDLLVRSFAAPNIREDQTKENLIKDLGTAVKQQQALTRQHPPLAIPPEEKDGKWQTFAAAWTRNLILRHFAGEFQAEKPHAATETMAKIFVAYAENDAQTFNTLVAKHLAALHADPPKNLDAAKTNFEAYFNHLQPFYHAAVLYVVAFLLVALSWLGFRRPLNQASFWLIAFTFAVHTFAVISRVYISGRPPVTNLYSSAVFIGWATVVLGLILEMVFSIGIGNVLATVSGFITLLIAHFLAGDGDTFTVLQAVLDTQFWLATHVVSITLGYSTTYAAGLLGVLYVLRGVLTPSLSPAVGKELSRMIYGTVCFAIFFSFVGTVLGGLWADDSWGRFWGWDPKENGALIIVLWNALVLHARWSGMVKERGLALLAVGGNIVTSWSWFGVNELGVGLHSYGFTEGVLLALGLFVGSQLAVIALGAIPHRMWWSSKRQTSQ